MPFVVDTNVPVVANGRDPNNGGKQVSIDCQLAAVTFLTTLMKSDKVFLDDANEIQEEYRRNLNPAGQPGLGDRFLQEVFYSSPARVERVALPKSENGEYQDLPQALIDAGFDPSDRKFAALAKRQGVPVANSVDSDWLHHQQLLLDNGITVDQLCGQLETAWWE